VPPPVDQLRSDKSRAELPDAFPRKLGDLPVNHPSAVSDSPAAEAVGADKKQPADSTSGAGSKPPDLVAGTPRPPLWRHVAHFRALWADHLRRWPDAPAKPSDGAGGQGAGDQPGSWRGGGDQYLTAEQHAEAKKVIESLQECEPAVTEILKAVELENWHAGVLVGLEHRRKDADRLKEKIAEKIDFASGDRPADVAAQIHDAVRYTFCFNDREYVNGHDNVVALLEARRCQRTYSRNHWLDGQQYKGINSQWRTAEGARFELQFHTRESFYAKETLTHPPYRRLRSPGTSWHERRELEGFQRLVVGAVSDPPGIDQIRDQERRA
jgi:hypothetical protein